MVRPMCISMDWELWCEARCSVSSFYVLWSTTKFAAINALVHLVDYALAMHCMNVRRQPTCSIVKILHMPGLNKCKIETSIFEIAEL